MSIRKAKIDRQLFSYLDTVQNRCTFLCFLVDWHNKSKMFTAPLPNELQDMILEKTDVQTCISLGRFDIAKKFGDNALASLTRSAITTGDLALVKTLLTTPALGLPDIMLRWKPNPFELAAEHGHLHVLQWLHENGLGGEPRYTMQRAINSRRLDIIKYLHDNKIVQRQISPDCIDLIRAAINGDLDIVRYFHKNYKNLCTSTEMDKAAESGHLHVVRYLHEEGNKGCTNLAMRSACKNGHFAVVRFLLENRKEGCIKNAIWYADRYNHQDIVTYLRNNWNEHDVCQCEGCVEERNEANLPVL